MIQYNILFGICCLFIFRTYNSCHRGSKNNFKSSSKSNIQTTKTKSKIYKQEKKKSKKTTQNQKSENTRCCHLSLLLGNMNIVKFLRIAEFKYLNLQTIHTITRYSDCFIINTIAPQETLPGFFPQFTIANGRTQSHRIENTSLYYKNVQDLLQ